MSFSHLGRAAVMGASVLGIVAVMVACNAGDDDDGWGDDSNGHHQHGQTSQCTNVVQQCQTVCQQQCDSYQCGPVCGQQCVNVCGDDDDSTVGDASFVLTDGGVTEVVDATAPPVIGDAGTGVLCSPCISNSDCETGALCILRGGTPDASGANGFCGTSCNTQSDCPDSFLCTQLGSSRQCVPTGNACQ